MMTIEDERGIYSDDEKLRLATDLNMTVVKPVGRSAQIPVTMRIEQIRAEIASADLMTPQGIRSVQDLQEELRTLVNELPDVPV